jgi:hypothetical protein
MKKIFYRISPSIFIVCLLVIIGSCKKETATQTQPIQVQPTNGSNDQNSKSDGVKVVDGRLVFPDQKTFDFYQNFVYENQAYPDKIKDFFKYLNFTSMQHVYEIGMGMDSESAEFKLFCEKFPGVFSFFKDDSNVFYELQAPFILANIANEYGIYQVDKRIIRLTAEYSLSITNGDARLIPMLMKPVQEISDPNIEIVRTVKGKASGRGQYSYRTAYFDPKHRLVARLTETLRLGGNNYYYYIEANTTAQKRDVFYIWWRESISSTCIGWAQGTCTDNYHQWVIPPKPYECTSSGDIIRTVFYSQYPLNFGPSQCTSDHKGTRGGTTIYIAANQIFP